MESIHTTVQPVGDHHSMVKYLPAVHEAMYCTFVFSQKINLFWLSTTTRSAVQMKLENYFTSWSQFLLMTWDGLWSHRRCEKFMLSNHQQLAAAADVWEAPNSLLHPSLMPVCSLTRSVMTFPPSSSFTSYRSEQTCLSLLCCFTGECYCCDCDLHVIVHFLLI